MVGLQAAFVGHGKIFLAEPDPNNTPPKVKAIPDDYGSLTTYVVVRGAAKFPDFLKAAFGAVERGRTPPGGRHYRPRGSLDRQPGAEHVRPKRGLAEHTQFLLLYVEDCDAVFRQAVEAGAMK